MFILYKEIIYLLFVGFIYHDNIIFKNLRLNFLKVKMEDVNKKKQKRVKWK